MKTIILAGGFGTRLSEETDVRPKPMIEIGMKPLLWHLMNLYSSYGFNDFVVALGYKQEAIKGYFRAFYEHSHDLSIDLSNGSITVRERQAERWRIDLIDTGLETKTGERISKLRDVVGDSTFMCTYGDGLSSIDVEELVAFHRREGRVATLTAVHPPARFGALEIEGSRVKAFEEKPQMGEGWINGGFFVFEPELFDYMKPDEMLEQGALPRLASSGQLSCFKHPGFFQPMDTLRDKRLLEALWAAGRAPWLMRRATTA